MNKKEAWNKFKQSGKVEDYLAYAEKKKDEKSARKSRRYDC